MGLYALVKPPFLSVDDILEYRDFEPNVDQSTLARHKPRWIPVAEEEIDPVSQVRDAAIIEAGRVVRPVRAKTENEILAMKEEKYEEIESEFQRLAKAPIPYEVGGSPYEFHADDDAVQNIMGIVILINSGVRVPDPRKWNPKDVLVPIDITHAEIVGLGAAIAGRKDTLHAIKKRKQLAVSQLTEPADVYAYDVRAGWDV